VTRKAAGRDFLEGLQNSERKRNIYIFFSLYTHIHYIYIFFVVRDFPCRCAYVFASSVFISLIFFCITRRREFKRGWYEVLHSRSKQGAKIFFRFFAGALPDCSRDRCHRVGSFFRCRLFPTSHPVEMCVRAHIFCVDVPFYESTLASWSRLQFLARRKKGSSYLLKFSHQEFVNCTMYDLLITINWRRF